MTAQRDAVVNPRANPEIASVARGN